MTLTCATPVIMEMRCEIIVSAYSSTTESGSVGELSVSIRTGMSAGFTFRKVNPADMPVLMLTLSSPTLPLSVVDEYAETMISQRISMITGVAQVNVMGAQKYAVRAQLDPNLLASRGIGLSEVQAALEKNNVNRPTGTLWGSRQAFTVQATGQLMSAAAFRPLIVSYRQ